MRNSNYTTNGLKRWSCKIKEIPGVPAVKSLHVYDFDNTLFSSPLPNPQLWHPSQIGVLQAYEMFTHGGWWHNPEILAATGEGVEKEEPRAWEGWWNETIVQLVRSSMAQKDALTVLLTGRNETDFTDLINKILNSKKLDFDMVVCKPEVGPGGQRFSTTIDFKMEFFKELVFTYKQADEIRVYEDRVKHVKAFRDNFERLNKSLLSHPADAPPPPRKPITVEVIHVCELKSALDPHAETVAIQTAINKHNRTIRSGGPNPRGATEKLLQIRENFVYFGYLINQSDSARLITLCNTPAQLIDSGEVKYMASNILIAPFYPRPDILDKVGGRGNKVTWQVNGVAKYEDRIWAARVAPVSVSENQIYTQDPTPLVVLAIRKGARPIDAAKIHNWSPVSAEKQFMFETTVGDRVMLKIEEMDVTELGRGGRRHFNHHRPRRQLHQDQDDKENNMQHRQGSGRYSSGKREQFSNRRQPASNPNRGSGGRKYVQGGHIGGQGAGVAGGGRNRRGGPPGYKSLDDYGAGGNFDGTNDAKNANTGLGEVVMNY